MHAHTHKGQNHSQGPNTPKCVTKHAWTRFLLRQSQALVPANNPAIRDRAFESLSGVPPLIQVLTFRDWSDLAGKRLTGKLYEKCATGRRLRYTILDWSHWEGALALAARPLTAGEGREAHTPRSNRI